MENSTISANGKSTHQCEVFDFKFAETTPIENTDNLHTFSIPGTCYSYVLNKNDWREYTGKTAWICPDTLVNVLKPEFNFLLNEAKYDKDSYTGTGGSYYRVKAKKIKGVVSYGLLTKIGDEIALAGKEAVWDFLGLYHYEAPVNVGQTLVVGDKKIDIGSNDIAKAPDGVNCPYYDLDSFQKYSRLFVDNELVAVSQKLEGENPFYIYKNGEYHCRSRNYWKKEFSSCPGFTVESLIEAGCEEEKAKELYRTKIENFKPVTNQWFGVLRATPSLLKFLKENEGYGCFGENYGAVKGFQYDCKQGERKFRAFDVLAPDGRFLDFDEMEALLNKYEVPMAPIIHRDYPFNRDELIKLGNEYVNQLGTCKVNEGIVVVPKKERFDERLGRVKLKIKSSKYLEKS